MFVFKDDWVGPEVVSVAEVSDKVCEELFRESVPSVTVNFSVMVCVCSGECETEGFSVPEDVGTTVGVGRSINKRVEEVVAGPARL